MPLFDELFASLPMQEIIYNYFLPFIIMFAVFYGVMSLLGIFSNKIKIILSAAFGVIIFQTPIYPILVIYITNLGGVLAVGAFILIFVVGIMIASFKRGADVYYEHGGHERKLRNLAKKIDEYKRKHEGAKSIAERDHYFQLWQKAQMEYQFESQKRR